MSADAHDGARQRAVLSTSRQRAVGSTIVLAFLLLDCNPAVAFGQPVIGTRPSLRKPLALQRAWTGSHRPHIVIGPVAVDFHSGHARVVECNSRRGCKNMLNVICVYAGTLVDFQNRSSALIRIAGQFEIQYNNLYGSFCKTD
jgi:hypothetical protein